jgi:hypothetical protein
LKEKFAAFYGTKEKEKEKKRISKTQQNNKRTAGGISTPISCCITKV